jgi:hypothetical protein
MPWAASIDRAHTWVHEPSGTVAAPVTFTPATKHYQSAPAAKWEDWYHPFISDKQYAAVTPALSAPGVWKGFVFRAPTPGHYAIVARTKGEGSARLYVNDSQSVVTGPVDADLRTTVFLTQGIHAVRLENLAGKFDLVSIAITPTAAPSVRRDSTPSPRPSSRHFGRLPRY